MSHGDWTEHSDACNLRYAERGGCTCSPATAQVDVSPTVTVRCLSAMVASSPPGPFSSRHVFVVFEHRDDKGVPTLTPPYALTPEAARAVAAQMVTAAIEVEGRPT